MAKTRELPGRKDRILHPLLRDTIEFFLLENDEFPKSFLQKDIATMVLDVAYAMDKIQIREVGGNNRGEIVGWVQSVIGKDSNTGTGEAWCMSLNQCIIAFIEDYLGVESPIIASENCMDVLRAAQKTPGLFIENALPGSFFIMGYSEKTGHTGTVLSLLTKDRMKTYEGNTSDSSVSDGNGAFLRVRPAAGKIGSGTIHGFVLVYPYNLIPKAV